MKVTTFSKTEMVNFWVGSCFALLFAKHSIFGTLGFNITPVAFLFLILFYFTNFFVKNESFYEMKFNYKSLYFIASFVFILLYGVVSTVINKTIRFDLVFSMLSIAFLFIFIKKINKETFAYMLWGILLITCFLSINLIIDRSAVMLNGVNYLLLSMPIGLSVIISSNYFFLVSRVRKKIILSVMCILNYIALFYLQSRGVIITTTFFMIFSLYTGSTVKVFFKRFALLLFIIFSLVVYYLPQIEALFESSIIYSRLISTFDGSGEESRGALYSSYFKQLHIFFFSGFGLGGTEPGLYSDTMAKYPHNLILEFMSEFGILGLIFSSSIVIVSFIRVGKLLLISNKNILIILIYLFYFMNFMKSFTIYQSTFFFISLGLLFNPFITLNNRDHYE